MEVPGRQAEMDADQRDLHVGRVRVRRGDGFDRVRRVDEDVGGRADLEIGHAVRIERKVAGAGDVALEGRHAVAGGDAGDAAEVDLAAAGPEVGDGVGRARRRSGDGAVGESDVARAAGQDV